MVLEVELPCALVSFWSAPVCVPSGGELAQQQPVTRLGASVPSGAGTISTNTQATLGWSLDLLHSPMPLAPEKHHRGSS